MCISKEIDIELFVSMAEENIDKAIRTKIGSDSCTLAKSIYKHLFSFYSDKEFSGDIIFSWKSPSLVKDGDYIGRRSMKVDNRRVIGNIFPNYKSERKYSLNLKRNGKLGDFPHDYFDIYLDHVAKYAYNIERPHIKEYYPLKRAILYDTNMNYFKKFTGFKNFLENNYFERIWEISQKTPFSDMEFDKFKEVSIELMNERGKQMIEKLIKII